MQSAVKALTHCGGWDVMASVAYALCHTRDGKLGRRKPEKQEDDLISGGMGPAHCIAIRAGGKCSLDGECAPLGYELLYTFQHKASGLDGHFFGVEWRETAGNLVGIDKFAAVESVRQYRKRCGGLASTVASGYDIESWRCHLVEENK